MKKHTNTILLIIILGVTSCTWAKNKAKKAVNKTGEIVAKTGSEFGNGMYKGVKKTFENNIKLSDSLRDTGLEFGEITINSSDSATDNVLTTYIIFNKDFDQEVTIKLLDENDKEYGRLTQNIKGEKGTAKYFDFIFDKHVNIGVKGNILFE